MFLGGWVHISQLYVMTYIGRDDCLPVEEINSRGLLNFVEYRQSRHPNEPEDNSDLSIDDSKDEDWLGVLV